MVISKPETSRPRVELTANQAEGLEELDQALQRQVLGLHGHDDPVGGGQGVDADRAQRGRAVEEGHGEALAHRAEALAQARLGALDAGQLDRGAGEVAVGGDEPEVVGPGRTGRLGDRDVAGQAVVGRGVHLLVGAQGDGRVALRVEVDEQGLLAVAGRAGGEVDRGGRLADAALLIRHRVDQAHDGAPYLSGRIAGSRIACSSCPT